MKDLGMVAGSDIFNPEIGSRYNGVIRRYPY